MMGFENLVYRAIKPLLFTMEPETAHELTLKVFGSCPNLYPNYSVNGNHLVAGIPFKSPIGLAAGADKDGRAIDLWSRIGFGFLELGTTTAYPQPGNPAPRLFRYPEHGAVINRMGFNNSGSAVLAAKLNHLREKDLIPCPVGVSIGKSAIIPIEEAHHDYEISAYQLKDVVDFFDINITSPNTPGLRTLLGKEYFKKIFNAVRSNAGDVPVFLKLSPDMDNQLLWDLIELAIREGISGFIGTNTSIFWMDGTPLTGGLSGRPLFLRAKEKIELALKAANGKVPVIGVGGIEDAAQAKELLDLGCAAVQIYTAMIFKGPGLIHQINRELGCGS